VGHTGDQFSKGGELLALAQLLLDPILVGDVANGHYLSDGSVRGVPDPAQEHRCRERGAVPPTVELLDLTDAACRGVLTGAIGARQDRRIHQLTERQRLEFVERESVLRHGRGVGVRDAAVGSDDQDGEVQVVERDREQVLACPIPEVMFGLAPGFRRLRRARGRGSGYHRKSPGGRLASNAVEMDVACGVRATRPVFSPRRTRR
jgi:hypothetical protein